MKAYKLMCSLFGHTGDVKSVCATRDNGGFVSVSRDLTAKLWHCDNADTSNQYSQTQTISVHKKYVNAVALVYTLKEYPSGLIITGSNDQTIAIHDIGSDQVIAQIKEHEAAVCTLYFDNNSGSNFLYSGSFDSTAKVWNLNNFKPDSQLKSSITLRGHEHTVWSVLAVESQRVVLTGSADKSIKHWQLNNSSTSAESVCKYVGHTDCVRGLALSNVNDKEFFSCSNDGSVIQWQLGHASPLRIFLITDAYLYSINMVHSNESNECLFITSGEDRSLRVHSTSKSASNSDTSGCIQTIPLPCQTLWSAICLPNGNLAVACNDGTIRLFTQKEAVMATRAEQEEYEQELAQFAIPVKADQTMSQIDRSQLPGIEALGVPGKRDGQPLMINNENETEVYQWSESEVRWIKIGVAVGSAGSGGGAGSSRQKVVYLGKEYDYVFDIELDDSPGSGSLKLPYNLSEDPYMVAQNFIYKHELSQAFLDEIANFIMKNTKSETIGSRESSYFDPFTGENRYVPGSYASNPRPSTTSSSSCVDPFTSSNAYNSGGSTTRSSAPPVVSATSIACASNEYFPHLNFILFDQVNFEPILKKLKEFHHQINSDNKNELITDKNNIELIEHLLKNQNSLETLSNFNDEIDLIFQMIEVWPKDTVFPLLDLTRILVLNKSIGYYITRDQSTATFVNKQGQHAANYYFDILLKLVDEDAIVNSMLVVKLVVNLFKSVVEVTSPGAQKLLAYLLHERVYYLHKLNTLSSSTNKSFQISLSTLVLNYVVLFEKLMGSSEKFSSSYWNEAFMEFAEFFNSPYLCDYVLSWDVEAIFRVLVSVGTLLSKTNTLKDSIYLVSVFKSLETFKLICEKIKQKSEKYPEKVHKSAGYLLSILS